MAKWDKPASATGATALSPTTLSPTTLSIDIGGTGLKASVLDPAGHMLVPRVRVATPYPCPPAVMLASLRDLVAPLPAFDRVSVGFPGAVRHGRVITAPHFGQREWAGYPFAEQLQEAFDRPVRLLNDAEVQGFGAITGEGVEMVLTLGTGAGTALFVDGHLAPHLELAQHTAHKGKTYNAYVGRDAYHKLGKKHWSKRVLRVIDQLDSLVHYDTLIIGGGNASHIALPLPERTRIIDNDAGITGGIALWNEPD